MLTFLLYMVVLIALFPFPGHLAVLALFCIGMLGLFLFQVSREAISIKQIDFQKNRYLISFMLFFFGYSLLSILWSKDLNGWLNYNIYLFIAASTTIVANHVLKNQTDFLKIFQFIAGLSIIHNMIGWINITTGNYILSSSLLITDFREKNNPLSLFNNTNDFATFLVFVIFINILVIVNKNNRFLKLLYGLNILSSIFLIYKTDSRGVLLALLLGIFCFFYLISKRKQLIVVLTVGAATAGSAFYFLPDVFRFVNNFLSTKVFNYGDVTRVNLVKNGFLFLKKSWGMGVGAGNIPFYLQNFSQYDHYNILSLHSWWLDILVSYGILVFIFYLFFYGKILVNLDKLKDRDDTFTRSTSICLLSILVSYIVGSNISSSNFPIMWTWIFFSLVISFINIQTPKSHSSSRLYKD